MRQILSFLSILLHFYLPFRANSQAFPPITPMFQPDCDVSQEWELRSALLVGERLTVLTKELGP
jgi:hypothetical protein